MKSILIIIITVTCFLSSNYEIIAQKNISPDKFIDKLLKDDYSMAVRIPGWVVRSTGKIASYDLEGDEKKIVRELSKSIRRARVLINTNLPHDYSEELTSLYNYFSSNNYDEYIQVRSEGNNLTLWAQQNGQIIDNIVLVVMNDEDDSAVINLNTKLDMNNLKRMDFFKKMQQI